MTVGRRATCHVRFEQCLFCGSQICSQGVSNTGAWLGVVVVCRAMTNLRAMGEPFGAVRTAALIFLLAVLGCGRSTSTTPPPLRGSGEVVVDSDRFPHALHTGATPEIRNYRGRGLGCGDCHDASLVRQGNLARPGTMNHAPCDDCHKAEFFKPPGPLCKVCHISVDPTAPRAGALAAGAALDSARGSTTPVSASPLQPYPERGQTQILGSSFSHQQHLAPGAMDSAVGFHVTCGDCHTRDGKQEPQVPLHAQCARCHEQQARAKAKLSMDNCGGCHLTRNVELARGRKFITGDLRFNHATHVTDRAGASVACAACHADISNSASREDVAVPAMERCAQCHEDSQRSPDRVRMTQCGVCHSGITTGTPPMNHGVTGAVPADHTLQFRKNHGAAAAKANSNCRFCHTQLSGAREDSCFQCHQVMKPRDHSMMWRDDHGKAAQADNDRCASCHTPDTCVACHSVPPRSHVPLGEFKFGGHAEAARFGITACMTCHTFQDTCSKCHRETR